VAAPSTRAATDLAAGAHTCSDVTETEPTQHRHWPNRAQAETIITMPKTSAKDTKAARPKDIRISDRLRLPAGPVDLTAIDTGATPGFKGSKSDGLAALGLLGPRLADLQERLFAEGRTGGKRSLLLVLQGMDTSGKGGTLKHTVGLVDPQGVKITSFKAPTKEELAHDFLWRIKARVPAPGMIGVFDRSHYEDVVVVRVRNLVEPRTWKRRYATINRFEEGLVARGTRVVKCFLHISKTESRDRLLARLDKPDKLWKFNPGDVDSRSEWEPLLEAYSDALERCATEAAPWHVVPADRKWYRNWAIMNILVEQLEAMAVAWPVPDFDVDEQRRRLIAGG
jgi:PPK2 family polyphosphate:nucleotide phosphotransferase